MTIPAVLLRLKAIGMKDFYHIQGFMSLLMKPRNGMRRSDEDKAAIVAHLKSLAASLPWVAIFTLPGGLLLLPLLAWHLDRRKKKKLLSIGPDSIKIPAKAEAASFENSSSAQPPSQAKF
jgi:hypothetical protein